MILERIIQRSGKIDWSRKQILKDVSISFPVPISHARYSEIQNYQFKVGSLEDFIFSNKDLLIIDCGVKDYVCKDILECHSVRYLEPSESKIKTIDSAGELLNELKILNIERIVSIGGGIISNVSAYVAEQLKVDLILFPTSLIAMSDASIGGKVRLNGAKNNVFIKHSYKSFYEPNEVIIDKSFIKYISKKWVRLGMAEIIKHAVYQSKSLTSYLLSKDFQPFDDESILRAVFWTADLKRICLELDPDESEKGSYLILRAAHDISDKIEERSRFISNHGNAVEEAMLEDLVGDKEKLFLLKSIYSKIGI